MILKKDTNKREYIIASVLLFLLFFLPVAFTLLIFMGKVDYDVIKCAFPLEAIPFYIILIMVILYTTIFKINKLGHKKNQKQNNFSEIIKLEDPKFNKKFNVYSSDQVEARYLVTPLFMEKFYNLKTVFEAKNIRCSFFDDNLMIAIDTKRDLFELGNLFKPVRDIKTIERFYDEITTIFDLIDYFKLNEDIYLK